ncbi:MAG: replication restart helicase PriA [Eubacteriales bacterium]
MMHIAEVYINQLHTKVDTPFDYVIPHNIGTVQIGMRVMVPFGVYNRLIDGIVVKIKEHSRFPQLKNIAGTIENYPRLTEQQINMCHWMCKKYHCFFMEAVHCYIPSNLQIKKISGDKGTYFTLMNQGQPTKYYVLSGKYMEIETYLQNLPGKAVKQREIIQHMSNEPVSSKDIKEITGCSSAQLKALIAKGMIVESLVNHIRNPYGDKVYHYPKIELNTLQKNAINAYKKIEKPTIFLLHGVTGSGKTEVYLHMMEDTMKKGKTCLYLVPEISLTSQIIERIMGRFKQNIGIIHSKLSAGEKIDQWNNIKNNHYNIVIGARSGVFAPMENLGLIILDEEHENTYKSSNRPRYITHDIAKKIASDLHCHVVLGSATPSIVSYYNALSQNYALLQLDKRATENSLPEVEIVDMKEELYNGNHTELSSILYKQIKQNLQNKEQTILFLNKRGYSSYVLCRSCGYVVKCPKCDVTMTYHRDNSRLLCHYCGYHIQIPPRCPKCESTKFKHVGSGTQKLESRLQQYYPGIRILRMDTDSMQKKGAYERVIQQFLEGQADLLLGTQMVTKGFDFENVTLVGVILADGILNLPDYKATERTFQLLTQVAGRAGRGKKPGKVIIQTYEPEHYSIQLAKSHDYNHFYHKEIQYRKMMDYPPYSDIVYFGFTHVDEDVVKNDCNNYYRELFAWMGENKLFTLQQEIFPPTVSPIKKINNKFRWYFIMKTKSLSMVNSIITEMNKNNEMDTMRSLRIIDINPNTII